MFPSAVNVREADTSAPNKYQGISSWLKNDSFCEDKITDHRKDTNNATECEELSRTNNEVIRQMDCQRETKDEKHSSTSDKKKDYQRETKDEKHSSTSDKKHDNHRHQSNDRRKEHKNKRKKSKNDSYEEGYHQKKRKHSSKHQEKDVSKKTHIVKTNDDEKTSLNLRTSCKSVWIEDVGPKALDVCCIDVKSDRNNLCFESVHFSDAAFYKRLGSSCLGLNKKQEISWYSEKEPKKTRKKHKLDNTLRYYSKESIKALINEENLLDLSGKKTHEKGFAGSSKSTDVSFIPLEFNSGLSFNASEVDPLNIHDQSTKHYLMGHIPEVNKKEINRELQDESDPWERCIRKKTAEYNKNLREFPNDAHLWMKFVKFQDEIASRGHSIYFSDEADDKRKKLSRLVIEKKIVILERAISNNPTSLALKLEHVELCKELWDSKQLKEHWDKMLFDHPNDPVLWIAYLNFVQSQFSTFTFNKVLSVYGKCIEKLRSILEGHVATHNPLPNTDKYLLDIFCQLCEFIRQSGHSEKAISCYQSMLEFNLFAPDDLHITDLDESMAFLETFWDSDEPKFGEKGACGWNAWMKMKQKGGWKEVSSAIETSEIEEDNVDEIIPESCRENWQAWLFIETAREQKHFLPWKPELDKGITEDYCEDPDRMVVYDDVSPFLFIIKTSDLKFKLLLNFLRFLGVAVAPSGSTNSYELLRHSIYALQNTNQIFSLSNKSSLHLFDHKFENVQISESVTRNCSPLDIESSIEQDFLKPPLILKGFKQFVRNVFAQSLTIFSGSERTFLLLLWIRFEFEEFSEFGCVDEKSKKKAFKQHLKDVRKFAKCILKEEINRNNLKLWEAYAKLEWKLGNTEEARRILGTALGMSSQGMSGTGVNLEVIPSLVYTYVNLELNLDINLKTFTANKTKERELDEEDIMDKLIKVLTWLGQGSESNDQLAQTSAPEILKSRRGFQISFEGKLEKYKTIVESSDSKMPADLEYFVEYISCYAWFQYITVGLKPATVVFEESLNAVKIHSVTKEQNEGYLKNLASITQKHYEDIYLNYIKLVTYHIYKSPTPLTTLRSILQRALLVFPRSPVFLQMFISLEMKSMIIGRVRRYFDSSVHASASPVTWLYSIQAEIIREKMLTKCRQDFAAQSSIIDSSGSSTGIKHRIRSLFKKAVEERVASNCVLLWRMFIHFEVSCGDLKNAKSLFYRAVQNCPWAKVLYLDAVRYFPDELQNILDILIEKGLHVRAPIEEIELLMKSKHKTVTEKS